MAHLEKPINEYDFKKGEKPEIQREEEKFFYRYFQLTNKQKRDKDEKGAEHFKDGEEDPEMEKFAQD